MVVGIVVSSSRPSGKSDAAKSKLRGAWLRPERRVNEFAET